MSSKTKFIKGAILGLIILLNSGVFFVYGIAKLVGIQLAAGHTTSSVLLKDMPDVPLMWYFFGLKKGYAILIAFSEILPALLIIFRRTRFLGSIMYLFTITNVLAINLFFGLTELTLLLSVVLFANTLIIIFYFEKEKLKEILK